MRNADEKAAVHLSTGFAAGMEFAAILANDPVTCEDDLRKVLANVARVYQKSA